MYTHLALTSNPRRLRRRKIKRSGKRSSGVAGDGQSDDDSASDDDLDMADDGAEQDDDDDVDGGTEVCPPGCEQALYERVCELREQRLDEDDAAADIARQADGLRKEREVLSKKARLVEQGLGAINQVGRA
jgi:cilia- and flagella-associated protein 44